MPTYINDIDGPQYPRGIKKDGPRRLLSYREQAHSKAQRKQARHARRQNRK